MYPFYVRLGSNRYLLLLKKRSPTIQLTYVEKDGLLETITTVLTVSIKEFK